MSWVCVYWQLCYILASLFILLSQKLKLCSNVVFNGVIWQSLLLSSCEGFHMNWCSSGVLENTQIQIWLCYFRLAIYGSFLFTFHSCCDCEYPSGSKYLEICQKSLTSSADVRLNDHTNEAKGPRKSSGLLTQECPPSQHGTFSFINRPDYDVLFLWSIYSERLLMIVLPQQQNGKACCGKWAVDNAPCLVIGDGSADWREWGSGCGINQRDGLTGMRIVQSYLQTTLALLFIARVRSVIFTCCDVWKEESSRNSELNLVNSKPFKTLPYRLATPVFWTL